MKTITKRKIGLFVGKLSGGGAERVVSRLSLYLSNHYDIYILIYNTKRIDYEYNGTIIDLGQGAGSFPLMALRTIRNINRAISENGIELVISLCDFPNIVNGLLNHSSKRVVSIRAHFEKNCFYTFADRLKRLILRKAIVKSDYIWALTQYQKDVLTRDLNIHADRIIVLPNIFDIKSIQEQAEDDIDPDVLSFINKYTSIAIGRLEEQKNYSELLIIFSLVNTKKPNAKLLVLGNGKLNKKLQCQAKSLGIEKNVLFLERVNNPFAYMKRCCAYISMTRYEGFPNSLIEAMALGLPVIHSDCPTGARDIIEGNSGHSFYTTAYAHECSFGVLTPIPGIGDNNTVNSTRSDIANIWINILTKTEYACDLSKKSSSRASFYDRENMIQQYITAIDSFFQSSP